MSDIILKIPRSTSNAKVNLVKDYDYDVLSDTSVNERNFSSAIMSKKRQLSKKSVFTEKFIISDSNQPLQISLKKVVEPSLTIEEAKIEIQKAYDKGFSDGKEITEITCQNENEKYRDWMHRIDNLAVELRKEYSTQIDLLQKAVLPVSVLIAKHIIDAELEIKPDLVLKQAEKAIAIVEEDTIFKIFCNPADVEILNSVESSLISNKNNNIKIDILPDSTISKGGCVLHTSAGIIDASIEAQMKRIVENFSDN